MSIKRRRCNRAEATSPRTRTGFEYRPRDKNKKRPRDPTRRLSRKKLIRASLEEFHLGATASRPSTRVSSCISSSRSSRDSKPTRVRSIKY